MKLHGTPVYNSWRIYFYSCAATMELNELLRFESPSLFPLFSEVFKEIKAKKAGVGGGITLPGKLQLWNRFGFLSYWVCPSVWLSFNEISEIACITSAWSSGGHALKQFVYGLSCFNSCLSDWALSGKFLSASLVACNILVILTLAGLPGGLPGGTRSWA